MNRLIIAYYVEPEGCDCRDDFNPPCELRERASTEPFVCDSVPVHRDADEMDIAVKGVCEISGHAVTMRGEGHRHCGLPRYRRANTRKIRMSAWLSSTES